MRAITVILFLFLAQPALGQESPLLRIHVHGKIGFIDTTGKVVIEPRFANVGAFHEGLAPAREYGTFGYIDTTGKYVIPPIYDFATEFHEGVGAVYEGGIGHYLDRTGHRISPLRFKNSIEAGHHLSEVISINGRKGIADRTGKLIVDTIYEWIELSESPVFVARTHPDSLGKDSVFILSLDGKTVYQDGSHVRIGEFLGNWAIFHWQSYGDSSPTMIGMIRTDGFIQMLDMGPNYRLSDPQMIDTGLCVYTVRESEHYVRRVFQDTTRDVIRRSEHINQVRQFNAGCAVAVLDDSLPVIFRRDGTLGPMIPQPTQWMHRFRLGRIRDEFVEGSLIVEGDSGFGLIDTAGRVLISLSHRELTRTPNPRYLLCGEATGAYSIVDLRDYWFSSAFLPGEPSAKRSTKSVLYVDDHGRGQYYTYDGRCIWKAPADAAELTTSSPADEMVRQTYEYLDEESTLDASTHDRQRLDSFQVVFTREEGAKIWTCRYDLSEQFSQCPKQPQAAASILLRNPSMDTVELYGTTHDNLGSTYVGMEAQDADGGWRAIEYQYVFCSTGDGFETLPPGKTLRFRCSMPEGPFETRLRVYVIGKDNRLYYSNVIPGHITPAQLWRTSSTFKFDSPKLETE